MGKGGCFMPVAGTGEEKRGENENIFDRVPHNKPPFTLSEIKKAIPPHCFNRSLIRSLSYPFYDLIVCFLLYYVATNSIPLLPKPLSYLAWAAYAYVQGCFMFGIWVVGHECGHQAFSNYHWVNDTVGFILHSLILAPYFSFKISHRHHHSNNCSIDRDENHVPRFKDTIRPYYRYVNHPLGRVFVIAVNLIVGYPLYMTLNISGHTYDRFTSHFYPYSPLYTENERIQVFLSDIGVLATAYLLYRIALVKGFASVMLVYGAPLLVMSAFLVIVGFLQHTHLALPHYDSSEWDWLRGALATVDRDYGILNTVFHRLTDTHVLHHLVSTIPHYHAEEATKAIKPLLGDYYCYDGTPFFKALWRETKECLYVEADQEGGKTKGVYWFKSKPDVKSS